MSEAPSFANGEEVAQPLADLPTTEEPILSQRLEFPDDVDEALLTEVSKAFDESLLTGPIEIPDTQPPQALEDAGLPDSSANRPEVVNGLAPTPVEAMAPMTSNEDGLNGSNAKEVGGAEKCWNNFTSIINRSSSNIYSLW